MKIRFYPLKMYLLSFPMIFISLTAAVQSYAYLNEKCDFAHENQPGHAQID